MLKPKKPDHFYLLNITMESPIYYTPSAISKVKEDLRRARYQMTRSKTRLEEKTNERSQLDNTLKLKKNYVSLV